MFVGISDREGDTELACVLRSRIFHMSGNVQHIVLKVRSAWKFPQQKQHKNLVLQMQVFNIYQSLTYEYQPPKHCCLLCPVSLKVQISKSELTFDVAWSYASLEKLATVAMGTSLYLKILQMRDLFQPHFDQNVVAHFRVLQWHMMRFKLDCGYNRYLEHQ